MTEKNEKETVLKAEDTTEANNKLNPSSISGVQYLLTVLILGAAWVVAFFSRLFAVVRFESIIHEFDPW